MDKTSIEIMQLGLEEYDRIVSPHYEALREQLAGQVALIGARQEERQLAAAPGVQATELERESRRKNFAMVNDFIHELPRAVGRADGEDTKYLGGGRFGFDFRVLAANTYTARQVQANVLWVNQTTRGGGRKMHPYYIVGSAEVESPQKLANKEKQLLLASAIGSSAGLITVNVWPEEFDLAYDQAQRKLYANADERTLGRMKDTEYPDMLAVKSDDTPLVTQHAQGYGSDDPLERFRPLGVLLNRYGLGIRARIQGWGNPNNELTDDNVVHFDIPTALNHLATAFDRVDELQTLLDLYAESA